MFCALELLDVESYIIVEKFDRGLVCYFLLIGANDDKIRLIFNASLFAMS